MPRSALGEAKQGEFNLNPRQGKSSEALLNDIELEIMDLRASLQMQGAHRDAIQETRSLP